MDSNHFNIETESPVYISLTTIPSRIRNTVEIIKNTLKHLSGFQKLILNVPVSYKKFKITDEFHECVKQLSNIRDSKFILNRTQDLGPITKLVGALSIIPEKCILIICDDDCYHHEAFKLIAEAQDSHHQNSFTFWKYTYPQMSTKKVDVPQGVDMISFWKPNLQGFQKYIQPLIRSPCFYVDDLVIGKFMQNNNIQIIQLERKWKWPFIPNCLSSNKNDESLYGKTGNNSRAISMMKCFALLI